MTKTLIPSSYKKNVYGKVVRMLQKYKIDLSEQAPIESNCKVLFCVENVQMNNLLRFLLKPYVNVENLFSDLDYFMKILNDSQVGLTHLIICDQFVANYGCFGIQTIQEFYPNIKTGLVSLLHEDDIRIQEEFSYDTFLNLDNNQETIEYDLIRSFLGIKSYVFRSDLKIKEII